MVCKFQEESHVFFLYYFCNDLNMMFIKIEVDYQFKYVDLLF